MQNNIYKDMEMVIDGMGIVIYSDVQMKDVVEGENYFDSEFSTQEKVAEHIAKGDIVGFNTGSGGKYNIKIRGGYPEEEISEKFPISIRLALDVKGNRISFIDLFWLMEWSDYVPEEQQIEVDEGIYHLTILTNRPNSGKWGDDQDIYVFMKKLEEMPKLNWKGVPQLFS